MATLHLASDEAANEFLASDPLGLLLGMLLDQQIPMEKAFTGPHVLAERLGVDHLDAAQLAAMEPEAFAAIFAEPPAIHRFPKAMAERTQKLAHAIATDYAGDAASVWTAAKNGADLVKRIGALPGYGRQKAQILTALLGKQFGVQPAGWRAAAGDYGKAGSFRSIADVVDDASLTKVREHKKAVKAAAKAAQEA
jgi:uncharacterized HhH-GPD family protein